MKKTLLTLACCVVTGIALQAQQKNWDRYSKNAADGMSDVLVNNKLYDIGPIPETPYLVKVTHAYTGAKNSKLPTKAESARLVGIQDATKKILSNKTQCYLAGAVSHNRMCEMYYYTKDTTGIRNYLESVYRKKGYGKHKIDMTYDSKWDNFFSVLYPDEEQRQKIYYQRMIARLKKAGYNLNKPHKVTYWAYFKDEENMRTWKDALPGNSYTLVSSKKMPYARWRVNFSKVIPITETSVLGSVKDLKSKLTGNGGAYGGWEILVSKK